MLTNNNYNVINKNENNISSKLQLLIKIKTNYYICKLNLLTGGKNKRNVTLNQMKIYIIDESSINLLVYRIKTPSIIRVY